WCSGMFPRTFPLPMCPPRNWARSKSRRPLSGWITCSTTAKSKVARAS
ncbi:uncharacterized protein METZ01_LOCUS483983, partial [marine metagenome]